MTTRIETIRADLARISGDRGELVGFLAGLRMQGEWRDSAVQELIRALPDAKKLTEDAKRWQQECEA